MSPAAVKLRLTQMRPMLAITDLQRTIALYQRLGFELNETVCDPPVWCELSRYGQFIMFNAPPRDSVIRDFRVKPK